MEKEITVNINGKDTAIKYNIKRLARLERSINQSLFYVMSTGGILKAMDINFTIAGLACGMPTELSLDEAADMLQKYCDDGGLLDDINDAIYRGIIASGLYVKGEGSETGKA